EEVVAALEQQLSITRKLVEGAKTRPPTDVLRLEALLEEARLSRARSQDNLEAAWQQLAAEVGLPQLSMPPEASTLPENPPPWDLQTVRQRVLAANTELKQVAVEAERARLAFERAKA